MVSTFRSSSRPSPFFRSCGWLRGLRVDLFTNNFSRFWRSRCGQRGNPPAPAKLVNHKSSSFHSTSDWACCVCTVHTEKRQHHPSLTTRMRPVARNASTHRAASADSSHKLASFSDQFRTANVASIAALASPTRPMTKKKTRVQFHNRQGFRKTVLPRSVRSCSTFRASRTIELRERRGRGRSSFTVALLLSSQPEGWTHGVPDASIGHPSASALTQNPRSAIGTRQLWSQTHDCHTVQDRQDGQIVSRTRRSARYRDTVSLEQLNRIRPHLPRQSDQKKEKRKKGKKEKGKKEKRKKGKRKKGKRKKGKKEKGKKEKKKKRKKRKKENGGKRKTENAKR